MGFFCASRLGSCLAGGLGSRCSFGIQTCSCLFVLLCTVVRNISEGG